MTIKFYEDSTWIKPFAVELLGFVVSQKNLVGSYDYKIDNATFVLFK